MAFKLKNIFSQLKKGQKERGMFSEKGKAERKEMRKTGESKFQFDVRKRRERSKQAKIDKPVTPTPEQLERIDPKSRLNIGREANTPSWEWEEYNPNDLTDKSKPQNFGIAPGMSFGEAFAQAGKGGAKAGTNPDTFFWTNPETGETKSFLYDFKNEETVVPDPYIGEEYDPTYKRKKDTSGKKEKQLRFPELGKYHYKNSPSYKEE
tara:strand:- start:44 stop:664 length:621 start_codon:yes stop_codon:yes gene_type:complete